MAWMMNTLPMGADSHGEDRRSVPAINKDGVNRGSLAPTSTFIDYTTPPQKEFYYYDPRRHSNLCDHPKVPPRPDLMGKPIWAQHFKETSGHWIYGFCEEPEDDAQTCLDGFWTPCVLYARTQKRLKDLSEGRDALQPTELTKCECGGSCWYFTLFCIFGLGCKFLFKHRKNRMTIPLTIAESLSLIIWNSK